MRALTDDRKKARSYRACLEAAAATWSATEADWQQRTGPAAFDRKKQELAQLWTQLQELPELRERRLDELKEDTFLRGCGIDPATLDATARKQALARRSFDQILGQMFSHSNPGADPADIARADAEITILRRNLEQQLATGLGQLQQLHAQILQARSQFIEPVRSAYSDYRQAQADLAATLRKRPPSP
jgi:hypothetical protein